MARSSAGLGAASWATHRQQVSKRAGVKMEEVGGWSEGRARRRRRVVQHSAPQYR